MTYQWSYRPWKGDRLQRLRADDILEATPAGRKYGKSKMELIRYGDIAYVAARITALSDQDLHLASLYFAGQAVELYLKALLYDRLDSDRWARALGYTPTNAPALPTPSAQGHNLRVLAEDVGHDHQEFLDAEFLLLCDRLTAFQEAGRYPDHKVQHWSLSLSRVTFLDVFIMHCRDIMNIEPWQTGANLMRIIFTVVPPSRSAEAAQRLGVLEMLMEGNDFLPELTGYSQEQIAGTLASVRSWLIAEESADGASSVTEPA